MVVVVVVVVVVVCEVVDVAVDVVVVVVGPSVSVVEGIGVVDSSEISPDSLLFTTRNNRHKHRMKFLLEQVFPTFSKKL